MASTTGLGMLVLGLGLGLASIFLMKPCSRVTVGIRVLRAVHINHENGNPRTACSVESGVGEVLPFPTNDAKMLLSHSLR